MGFFQYIFTHTCGSAGRESLRPTGILAHLHSAPACPSLRNHGISPFWWGPVSSWILCAKTGRIGMLCGYKSILVEVTTSKVSPEKYRLALLFGVLKASKFYCWGQGTWARGIRTDIWCAVWSWIASWLGHGDSLLMNWVCLLVEFAGFETKYNPGDGVELKILDCSKTTSQRQEGSSHVLFPNDQKTSLCYIGYPTIPNWVPVFLRDPNSPEP